MIYIHVQYIQSTYTHALRQRQIVPLVVVDVEERRDGDDGRRERKEEGRQRDMHIDSGRGYLRLLQLTIVLHIKAHGR